MSQSFLRLATVKARTGLSRSTIYRRMAEGCFPQPISLGGRSVAWVDGDVNAWIAAQIEAARARGHR